MTRSLIALDGYDHHKLARPSIVCDVLSKSCPPIKISNLPVAIAYCHCLLLLPVAIAYCCCLSRLPIAIAHCFRLLSLPIGDCPLPSGDCPFACFSLTWFSISNCAGCYQHEAIAAINAPPPISNWSALWSARVSPWLKGKYKLMEMMGWIVVGSWERSLAMEVGRL